MYIEMELFARERYETRLREAREFRLGRNFNGSRPSPVRADRLLPFARLRQR